MRKISLIIDKDWVAQIIAVVHVYSFGRGSNHRPPLPLARKSLPGKHNLFFFNKVSFLKAKMFSAQFCIAHIAQTSFKVRQVFLVFHHWYIKMTNTLQQNSCHDPVHARPGPEVMIFGVCFIWSFCGEYRYTQSNGTATRCYLMEAQGLGTLAF